MVKRVERVGESVILYDDSLLSHRSESLFDPASWPDAPAAPGYAGGRGNTLFIAHQEQQCEDALVRGHGRLSAANRTPKKARCS